MNHFCFSGEVLPVGPGYPRRLLVYKPLNTDPDGLLQLEPGYWLYEYDGRQYCRQAEPVLSNRLSLFLRNPMSWDL